MLDYTLSEVVSADIHFKTVFIPVAILNKKQYSAICSYIRTEHEWDRHCEHEWDCCGCMCSQHSEVTRFEGKIGVLITSTFNY